MSETAPLYPSQRLRSALLHSFLVLEAGYRFLERFLHAQTKVAVVSRWRGLVTKRYLVHGVFLLLALAVVFHSRETTGADRSSLLYALVSGEVVIEGPLDPAAYAQADTPGIGGSRLAAIDADEAIDLITFDDPEVEFATSILDGNAVVATNAPLVPEPGTEDAPPRSKAARPTIYEIQEGDTLSTIAAKFDISENTVAWANGLSSRDVLKVGDHLTILPTTGVLHTVKSGDTVLAIAHRYDAKGSDVEAYNNLDADASLQIGQKIMVPDGYIEPITAPRIVPRGTRIAEREPDGPTPGPADTIGAGAVWPTTTHHISQGFRWGHTGFDLDNKYEPAFAALGGTVEFVGWLGGYGNLIILNHGSGLQTYYAHLSRTYVGQGETVAKGAAVGKVGSTGRSSGPHLHFEVRRGGRPVNPFSLFQ